MKQILENQTSRAPKRQKPPEQETDPTLKSWLLKKLIQYMDNTFQTLFTAAILGGVLWLLQHLWGLRLVPFNVLDAILLVIGVTIALLILIGVLLWWIFNKFPILFVLLGILAFLIHLTRNPEFIKQFATSGLHWSANVEKETVPKTPAQEERTIPNS